MIGIFHISNLITYLGLASAVLGMAAAINDHTYLGFIALVICGICDLFDGVFARRFKRNKDVQELGIQLDSLADAISFGALPAVLLLSMGLNSWYHLFFLVFYCCSLVTRLGFFNLTIPKENLSKPVNYYRGLPSTYAAFFLPLTGLLQFWLSLDIFSWIYTIVMLIVGILFILDIKISKPRGVMYGIFSTIAIAVIALFLILR